MATTKEYHRPTDLKEALALLQRPEVATVPLAGGTWLVPNLRGDLPDTLSDSIDAVVDLGELGLSYVDLTHEVDGSWLRLGATTTLAELIEHPACQIAGGLLAEAARREGPVNLRNAATIAGLVVQGNPESELLLALLVLAAHVLVDDGKQHVLPLPDLLADPQAALAGGLVTEIRLPVPAPTLRGGLARVARTPKDHPIVAAAAVVDDEGARLALGGVSPKPLLLRLGGIEGVEAAVDEALQGVRIPADFRGSADYRRAMAPVVARRAIAATAL